MSKAQNQKNIDCFKRSNALREILEKYASIKLYGKFRKSALSESKKVEGNRG
jgi:hypothetical protein